MSISVQTSYDVVVIGGGNAGLCAAIAAAQAGGGRLKVLVVEKALREERGGNSSLGGHMRFVCETAEDLRRLTRYQPEDYEWVLAQSKFVPRSAQDYWDEAMRVTEGMADQGMLEVLSTRSYETVQWLHDLGHHWVLSTSTTTQNTLMFEGGGAEYQKRAYRFLDGFGVEVRYGCAAIDLVRGPDGGPTEVVVVSSNASEVVYASSVILACGGFESSPEMRGRYLGDGWDTVRARGVPFNTGDGLRMAIALGAATAGSWTTCHASPQDVARPDGALPSGASGTEWDRYLYPYGIMVNADGRRFIDEGRDVRSRTYAQVGRRILAQPGHVAYQIFDAKVRGAGLIDRRYERGTGERAQSLEELAAKLGIDVRLGQTVSEFNRSLPQSDAIPPSVTALDGRHTTGLALAKSNFSVPIDIPPFEGYAVACGITFTFGGIRTDSATAQVLGTWGAPIPGLFAAGEIVGGLWHGNYASGSGMMAGSVFGRLAGASAAKGARSRSGITA
jgi:tricarballylate dehydrogenase